MPLEESVLGFSNRWYARALSARREHRLPSGARLQHIDAPHFLATKLEAFRSRGRGDYLASTDVEDVVVVLDGRPSVEEELAVSSPELRGFVAREIAALLEERHFLEALPTYFTGEAMIEQRARALIERTRSIARQGR